MEGKSNGVDNMDWARLPPPTGPLWKRMANVVYNPEEKSLFGRTPKRWGIVIAFYTVFYAVLAVMFALCMGGLSLTLDDHTPAYLLADSLIGANPGVAHRPRPADGFVVRFNTDNSTQTDFYLNQMREFFQDYANESWYTSKTKCTAEDNFGFPDSPCFYIKLNKIYGWTPEFYDVSSLPEDMPPQLTSHINSLSRDEQKQVWVSCEEEKAGNSTGIQLPWGMGLPGRFYPFRNERGFRSPLVAVQLDPPANTLVTIRCRAWAKNVIYNKSLKEPSGYTLIQLYIEDHSAANDTGLVN